ncbi:hypothetical protein CDL12_01466 [Handroanthus impetiginosus]|uniref:Uncharacterized protein n=1 Tax=Handroanthus impetiginosus TaxID=429701 RepID=A0A2G9I7R2_9LAMI|nr:hypothetical protein CDL12_01466 [Handroanthus impetiginosus]
MTTPKFKIEIKMEAGGSSHRKDKGKDTTERSKNAKDKGKNQVTVTEKKGKHSTPQAVDSKYKSSKDKSSHGGNRPRNSSESGAGKGGRIVESRRPSGFAPPPSQPRKLELKKCERVMIKEKISHSKGKEAGLIVREAMFVRKTYG